MRGIRIFVSKAAILGCMLLSSISAGAQKFEFYDPDRIVKDGPKVNVQIRTNLLHDAIICPNIGFELQVGKGFAFDFDYGEAWWNSFSRNKFYSVIYFQGEVRKYIGKWSGKTPYRGHHVGVYMQMAAYDLENGGRGYIAPELDNTIGAGISYGYSFRLSDRLSLDCTLGVGYMNSEYETYLPVGDMYVSTGNNSRTWVGPTKIEASLVWNLFKKNRR